MRREIKIGITGIIALALLFWGIKFLKGVNLLQVTSDTYHITFANAKGLTPSSTVYADGYKIGIVDDIRYQSPGVVVVSVTVDGGVKIPRGTLARLDEGMLGGCTLNMTMGPNPADCHAPGDTISGTDASGLMDGAAALMPQLEELIGHVDQVVTALGAVVANPDLPVILANARQLTESLNESTERLNTLLDRDLPQLTATYTRAGESLDTLANHFAAVDAQATLDEINATLESLRQTTDRLTQPDNNVGMLLSDTALYGNINGTLQSAATLLGDLKEHPSRYINVSVFGGRKRKD